MNIEEKVIEFINSNNGYITTSDILNLNISKSSIPNLIENGIIYKVCHGLYLDTNKMQDDYFVLQYRYPKIIYCFNSAFFLHNSTNRTPSKLDVMIIRDMRVNLDANINYCSKSVFDLGVVEVKTPFGNIVRAYNLERSICDLYKNDVVDIELKNRIVNSCFSSGKIDIDKLLEYSKILKVYNEINLLVEMMMKW